MKYILIIGDGMADNPVPTLDNKTPLQHAAIPVMDGLAAKGEVGNVVNCPAGLPAGSDTAILSIFGADPNVCYTGRSPLEAAATGIQLQPGDISYRCNMVTYEDSDLPFEEKRILSHSGGSIEGDQSIQLITDLFRDPAFQQAAQQAGMVVHPAASFRGLHHRDLPASPPRPSGGGHWSPAPLGQRQRPSAQISHEAGPPGPGPPPHQ